MPFHLLNHYLINNTSLENEPDFIITFGNPPIGIYFSQQLKYVSQLYLEVVGSCLLLIIIYQPNKLIVLLLSQHVGVSCLTLLLSALIIFILLKEFPADIEWLIGIVIVVNRILLQILIAILHQRVVQIFSKQLLFCR